MITMYSDAALRRWNKGEFKVQLDLPTRNRPMGYCDGTPEDEAELLSMAEGEGEAQLEVHKRLLRTGREIWTLKTASNAGDPPVDED
jgi:hypothetical protein